MKDYRSIHLVEYDQPDSIGWRSMTVLHILIGLKWGQLPLNYIHSLRPSYIRVTTGEETMDFRLWRVTVLVDESDTILHISQEVEVGCEGYDNAYDMDQSLENTLTIIE